MRDELLETMAVDTKTRTCVDHEQQCDVFGGIFERTSFMSTADVFVTNFWHSFEELKAHDLSPEFAVWECVWWGVGVSVHCLSIPSPLHTPKELSGSSTHAQAPPPTPLQKSFQALPHTHKPPHPTPKEL